MAAAGLVSARESFSGLRPVHLRRDLGQIADLIEYSFAGSLDAAGRAAIQEMRIISRSGPVLWGLSRLSSAIPGLFQGFVWVENGRLIGNVSIAPAGHDDCWVIANVAVYPEYRRRGIARDLMQASLNQIRKQGRFAILQVEADNAGARALYESLDFYEQRTFTRWRRATTHLLPDPQPEIPTLRKATRQDADALLALAETLRPNDRGGMGWQRPTRHREFTPPRWQSARRLLSGQSSEFWIVPGVRAALGIETRLGCLTVPFDLLVHPDEQGNYEAALIHDIIRRMGRSYPLITDYPADDEFTSEILRQNQFRPERTLVHMIRPV
jgi:ribosomal protein S18 acetylase RimI-like enzyme